MNIGAVKENENPVVHKVQDKRKRGGKKPLGWSQIAQKLNFAEEENDDGLPLARTHDWAVERTAEDRAIFHALADTAAAKPTNVGLLRNAGLTIPSSTGDLLRAPNFVPRRPAEEMQLRQELTKRDEIDAEEVFSIIRNIQDPEHPLTLEQLNVVNRSHIEVHDNYVEIDDQSSERSMPLSTVDVRFTPTIPHCSMATLIGLSLRVKLLRSLPPRFKVTVRIEPGTHASENAINKQLADKERVCAALENKHLLGVVNRCIENGMKQSIA